ncbi:protein TIFY 10A-like [Camellia sinensis]|uniref:protein TIFY 10A-like n=1 Tax=Camellia sinensis TaxID=4442 RepID=UPI001035FDB6|nr:protein TIFY 10A-like [Camellia sinensis]
MASSQVFSDDRRSGKSPEKSNFALTCNRLSQFLKERRSLGDLGFEIAGKIDTKGRPETTRNMVPKVEKPVGSWAQHGLMDLFPQHADLPNKSISRFVSFLKSYALIKAGDLMLFAGSETNPVPAPNPIPALGTENQIKSGVSAASGSFTQNHLQSQTKATHSDLPVPIARRASLHRFFEKRKDRATARAPYQVHGGPSTSSSSKHEEQLDLKL